jgi:hypothetical protein
MLRLTSLRYVLASRNLSLVSESHAKDEDAAIIDGKVSD